MYNCNMQVVAFNGVKYRSCNAHKMLLSKIYDNYVRFKSGCYISSL